MGNEIETGLEDSELSAEKKAESFMNSKSSKDSKTGDSAFQVGDRAKVIKQGDEYAGRNGVVTEVGLGTANLKFPDGTARNYVMDELLAVTGTGDAKSEIISTPRGDFEIEIIDGTHIKFRVKGTERWAIPLHFNQVDDTMMDALKKKGVVQGNFFKE